MEEYRELMKVLTRIADALEANEYSLDRLIELIDNALEERENALDEQEA